MSLNAVKRLAGLAILSAGVLLFQARDAQAIICGLLTTCTCTLSTASSLNFGAYDPFSQTDTTVGGTITVACQATGILSTSFPYTLSLNAGVNSGSSFTPRKLKLTTGSTLANYNIFTDSAGTQILGNGTSSTVTVAGTCNIGSLLILGKSACSIVHNFYGRVFYGQTTLVPGTYNDTLTWTLSY